MFTLGFGKDTGASGSGEVNLLTWDRSSEEVTYMLVTTHWYAFYLHSE